jgi:DNA-binding LytR/AlgR family response regulator
MTTATALIADDEEAPREQLAHALAQVWPDLKVVAKAVHGADAWDAFLEHEPDVCFLDIRMPGLTGIEVAKRINGASHVVFVTAFDDQAVPAFDMGAIDYVLKPVETTRLQRAVDRVKDKLSMQGHGQLPSLDASLNAQLQGVLAQITNQWAGSPGRPSASPKLTMLQASLGREVRMIPVDDVLYFESDARYTRVVYRSDGQDAEALIRTPLKELLTQLDAQHFIQIHRSVIVNQRSIQSAVRIDENNMHLTLRLRNEKLPVSRHFQGLFKGQ